MCKTSQQELQELATKHQEQITELAEEQTKILVSGRYGRCVSVFMTCVSVWNWCGCVGGISV